MRKSRFILYCLMWLQAVSAQAPHEEFRATWLTTLKNIDWPITVATTPESAAVQQTEMTDILDRLQEGNINAICFQARPSSDALYHSSQEPWSPVLTGIRGMDPGFDPLAFAIEQAHNRGMELHAWVNPFRYERTAGERIDDIEAYIASEDSDPIRIEHPEWLLTYNTTQYKGAILDPGHPEARAYVLHVIMEIVNNYNIDGLVMDDYFYPYGGTTDEDINSRNRYKPDSISIGDWRRLCVNEVIRAIYDSIQTVKPWVKFGMAPFGIYSMTDSAASRYGLTLPEGISGTDAWADLYCDPLAWVEGGYVDYLAPQLYWSTKATKQSYEKLCKWWCESVATLDARRSDAHTTHVYISHAAYRFDAEELGRQIEYNRQYAPHNAPGSIFYNTNQYLNYTGAGKQENTCQKLRDSHFSNNVLPPLMVWKRPSQLSTPATITTTDTLNACCDTISPTWQQSRFRRMTIRQKADPK